MIREKDILKLAKEIQSKMTAEEVFRLPQCETYVNNLLNSVVAKRFRLILDYDTSAGAPVGYTDSNEIYLNAGSEIVLKYQLLESKLLSLLGVGFHETAHINFLDFDTLMQIFDEIKAGDIVGELEFDDPDDEDEFNDFFADETCRKVLVQIYKELHNVIADAHDEMRMCEKYRGLVERAITFSSESLREGAVSLETLETYHNNDNISSLNLMYSLILQYARYGTIIMESEKSQNSDYLTRLINVLNAIDYAKIEDDILVRHDYINEIIPQLWSYIKEEYDNQMQNQQNQQNNQQSNSQSSAGSSGSDGSSSNNQNNQQQKNNAIDEILKQLGEAAKNAGQSNTNQQPQSAPKGVKAGKSQPKAKASSKSMSEQEALEQLAKALSTITKEVAAGKASRDLENSQASDIMTVIKGVNQPVTHAGLDTQVVRVLDVSEKNKSDYRNILDSVRSYSRSLQKQILNILKDLNDEGIMKHKAFGTKLESKDAYRVDSRMFSKKKLPMDLPNMAVSMLIDLSGSMNSPRSRIESATKAAILMEDFCRNLNIPLMIAGHQVCGNGIRYTVFSTFDKYSNNDRYRLASLPDRVGSCNRDGMAIKISLDLLEKRPEEVKLFIIISDGQPNDTGYSGETAAEDIRAIVKAGKKKGITTFAYAIGDDKERIKNIYKDGFVDISDLSTLPKVMAKMVKKRII